MAIQLSQESLAKTPRDHPDRASRLHSLGANFRDKYVDGGSIEDLDRCMQLYQESVDTTPLGSVELPSRLDHLAIGHFYRYTLKDSIKNFNSAIQLFQDSMNKHPPESTEQATGLQKLGICHHHMFLATGNTKCRDKCIELLEKSFQHPSGIIRSRLDTGKLLMSLYSDSGDWENGCRIARSTIDLVPLIAPWSLENSDKQHFLSRVAGLASNAAAISLNAGETPSNTLKLLETDRGIIADALNNLRLDPEQLLSSHPNLGERYIKLRTELDNDTSKSIFEGVAPNKSFSLALQDRPASSRLKSTGKPWHFDHSRGDLRYNAQKDLINLIDDIQSMEGFEDFLVPPTVEEMKIAARHGPIIIINVSEYRCDAILVEYHHIRVLPLPQLSSAEIEKRARAGDLGNTDNLKWLWDSIAEPVLEALGFTATSGTSLRRIWWVPTQSLTKFPIHAAGYHERASLNTVLDRAMSSYASSVKAIIYSRQHRFVPSNPCKALLVAMEDTPGIATRLPFAGEEISVLRGLLESMKLEPIEPKPTTKEVLSHLPECMIFHFAGHGYTDERDPSRSELLLGDRKENPLTVASLLELNLRKRRPFLAYLSACGTGRIKDMKFTDESIHLTSACQLAGFRHVIGTLWEVNDKTCVEIARKTYEVLVSGGLTYESVCRALHEATVELRNQWLHRVDENELVSRTAELLTKDSKRTKKTYRKGNKEQRDMKICHEGNQGEMRESLNWVPYVHFGV